VTARVDTFLMLPKRDTFDAAVRDTDVLQRDLPTGTARADCLVRYHCIYLVNILFKNMFNTITSCLHMATTRAVTPSLRISRCVSLSSTCVLYSYCPVMAKREVRVHGKCVYTVQYGLHDALFRVVFRFLDPPNME